MPIIINVGEDALDFLRGLHELAADNGKRLTLETYLHDDTMEIRYLDIKQATKKFTDTVVSYLQFNGACYTDSYHYDKQYKTVSIPVRSLDEKEFLTSRKKHDIEGGLTIYCYINDERKRCVLVDEEGWVNIKRKEFAEDYVQALAVPATKDSLVWF